MRTFPTREALVAAYWLKLASSDGVPHKSRRRVFARHAVTLRRRVRRLTRVLQTH